MNRRKLIITIASLFTICAGLFAKGDTYNYDYWSEIQKSPDTYRVSHVIYADDLKLDKPLKNPTSLFAYENFIYVVDSDNNRIIELEYTDKKMLELRRVITSFNAPEDVINTFNGPKDMFVDSKNYYIADTGNGRVVKLDKDFNYIFSLTEPDDVTYDKSKEFLPEKVVADSKGRVYIASRNVNKGFIKYEYDGQFQGYFGASEVIFNFTDMLWKKFATQAQKERMVSFVPTEYCNCYIDKEGFIYAVTKTFDEWDLLDDKAKPIRRLNALGKDILVKNGDAPPVGDLQWSNAAGIKDPSKFSDVTVLDNEVYICLDETRGRLFAYDNQGYLLFAFGGRGNIDGFFRLPNSIEHVGKDLFVLDNLNASITVFTPTEYGNLIYKATEEFACGEYDQSAETWEKVLQHNGKYDLAYIGLGKAYLRQNKFAEAMDCFKTKHARRNYSKAFKYYRKEWIESNIGWIAAIIIILIVLPTVIRFVKRIKWEFDTL